MKIIFVTAFLLIVQLSQAATIIWGTSTNVSSAAEILTTGSLNEAYNLVADGVTTSPTINGVTFTAKSDLLDRSTTADRFLGDTGSVDYNNLLSTFDFGGGDPATVSVGSSLVVGNTYQIQIWFSNEGSTNSQTYYSPGDSATSSVTLTGVSAAYAIGTFVADAATQSLVIDPAQNNGHLGAYQIRDLGVVPEPSSLALLALGCFSIAFWRQRRK